MSSNPFYRLAPFIQNYIYNHRWDELRDIQVQAIEVIFDTPNHLILAAGTASGKTEAAFLPILSDLDQNPSSSIGVLYIGPTKALINDQFYRLEGLLQEADIPVWAWHGDVSSSRKNKLLNSPRGVLQITPESLESLLINRVTQLPKLFGNLHYVVLDEVHIFMNSDRGRQVLCQLARLEKYTSTPPRRVGLSATLGDQKAPEVWLRAGTTPLVTTVKGEGKSRVRLSIEHFYHDEDEHIEVDSHDQYIYERTKERTKSLIFANSRGNVEKIIASLRQIARRQNQPDIYHVHHGSIAAPLRETAELAMKAENQPAVTAATITLELGIDIGQLERVIQLGAPFSVSSFLQRLGRSGRRGNPSEMWFVFQEDTPSGQEKIGQQFPWTLLQAIAIIQLYIEERWIEPIAEIRYPFSLLYHQTMSVLAGSGELSPADLARRVLTLPPFQHVSPEDYRILLQHLLAIDHLERMPTGGLIIGLAGEKIVRNYRFYAVFKESEEFSVRSDEGEIGRVMLPPPVGERFMLAGRTWEVLDVNTQQKVLFVRRVYGKGSALWAGRGGDIHQKILKRMKQVLFEDNTYSYLQPNAQERLHTARQLAQKINLQHETVVPLSKDTFCVFPWMGSKQFEMLCRYFTYVSEGTVTLLDDRSPYYLEVRCSEGIDAVNHAFKSIYWEKMDSMSLVGESEVLDVHKFDEFIPVELLREAYANDFLTISIDG